MEAQTIQRYIHISPRKLRLVADMIRTMTPTKALDILQVTPKYAAKDLIKALQTVLANAKVAGMDLQKIEFKKLEIDESMKMRRFRAGTRGRVKPYKKRMSHIKIVLSDELVVRSKKIKNEKIDEESSKEKIETINAKKGTKAKS